MKEAAKKTEKVQSVRKKENKASEGTGMLGEGERDVGKDYVSWELPFQPAPRLPLCPERSSRGSTENHPFALQDVSHNDLMRALSTEHRGESLTRMDEREEGQEAEETSTGNTGKKTFLQAVVKPLTREFAHGLLPIPPNTQE